jgi:hypothetical protein
MTWQTELRGVSKVNLACAALMVPIGIWAGSVALSLPTQETRETQETQVQETQGSAEEYKAVWDWCGVRFPFRQDLQGACRWGAYEWLPGQVAPAAEGIRNVMDRS